MPGGFNGALHSLSQVAIAHKDTLSPEQTATMLHAIAMLGEWDLSDEVEKALIQRAVATVGEFGPQSISETMLSVTKLFVKPDAQLLAQLVAVMSARTLEVAAHMRAKDVSDVLWALGELKAEVSEPLLDALEQRAVQVSDHFLAGEISDLLWAVAAMEKAVQWELVLALQRRAYEVMPEFNKLEARRCACESARAYLFVFVVCCFCFCVCVCVLFVLFVCLFCVFVCVCGDVCRGVYGGAGLG